MQTIKMNIKINNSKHTSLTSTRNVNFSNQKKNSNVNTSKEPTHREHLPESRTANSTVMKKDVFNNTSLVRGANSTVNVTKYKSNRKDYTGI